MLTEEQIRKKLKERKKQPRLTSLFDDLSDSNAYADGYEQALEDILGD